MAFGLNSWFHNLDAGLTFSMMDVSTSLTLCLHVVLLLMWPSTGDMKRNGRCEYVQISDWSDCDLITRRSTRNLELLSGDAVVCNKDRVESRDCWQQGQDEIRMEDTTRHKLNNKKKRLKGRHKKTHVQQDDCRYKKSKWSSCDTQSEGTQTLVQTLVPGSVPECQQVIVATRSCVTKLEMVETEEENTGGSVKRDRKNSKDHRRKRKSKNKKMEVKKEKKRINNKSSPELAHEPPPPTELHVEPLATSAVVSWQPPQTADFSQHIPVDNYKIGYGQGFPDLHSRQVNGQELAYRINNLEPGREYIVSLRAQTSWGVSQPLYETIMTRATLEGAEQVMLAPVGVQPIVLSSDVINVTWVDMSRDEETMPKQREYYLRYQQRNHLSSSSLFENDVKIQHTSHTFVVVSSLLPFTKYEFAVMAADGERNSSWSVVAWNVTQEAEPSTAPRDLTVIQEPDNPEQIILSWQPPSMAGGIITGYQVSYSTVSVAGQSLMATKDVQGNKLSVTLTNLVPGLTYDFSVRARNSKGIGPLRTVKDYHLAADETVKPPRKLHVGVLSATSAVVSWQDPGLIKALDDGVTSPVRSYTVSYCSLDEPLSNCTLLPSPLTTLYVADLLPLTWYEFKVKVHRGHLESQWSLPIRNRTLAAENKLTSSLPTPENLQVTVMSSNSALISWQDSELAMNKDIASSEKSSTSHIYTLRYRDLSRQSSVYRFASPTLTSIFMVDLEPATRYEFSVRTDRGGDEHSEWSSPVVNTTFESAPSTGPSHVTISMDDEDPTTAFLKWQPPDIANGDITGYIVFYETARDRRSATVPAGELSYRIPFLKPHTKYFFRIGAWNSQGFSPLSNRVVYRTPRVVGLPPADVTVSPVSDDMYNAIVSWQPPSPNKRKIKFYTVTSYTEDGKQRTVLRVAGFTLSTVVKRLLPSTVYHLTVQAHYQRDSGPHSVPVVYSIPKELISNS